MLLAHEHQHNETMLQLLQMIESYGGGGRSGCGGRAGLGRAGDGAGGQWRRESGPPMRDSPTTTRDRHPVELAPFVDRTPVTNGAYIEFIEDTDADPPMYWERDGDGWTRTVMGRTEVVDPRLR